VPNILVGIDVVPFGVLLLEESENLVRELLIAKTVKG
jgi:hypothetical protein